MVRCDGIIVITPRDFPQLVKHYKRLVINMPSDRLLFVSGDGIEDELNQAELGSNVSFVHEDELLTFESVRACLAEHLKPLLGSEPVHRVAVGWYCQLNTPGLFEPPVRSLRATIPDAESHQQYYSTVLLTRASTAYNFCGKQAIPLPTAGLPRRISLSYAYSCKEPFAA